MAEALRKLYTSKGQGHVFQFYDSLSAEQQARFLEQLSKIDLDEILQVHKGFATANKGTAISVCKRALTLQLGQLAQEIEVAVSPFPHVTKPDAAQKAHYWSLGYLTLAYEWFSFFRFFG